MAKYQRPIPKGETREIRIFSGEPHNVITLDGKIIKDLGPVKKDPNLAQRSDNWEQYKGKSMEVEEKKDSKIEIIPGDDVAGKNQIEGKPPETPKFENFPPENCPQCKSKNIEPSLYLENSVRYKCNDCSETFVAQKHDTPIFIPNYLNPKPRIEEVPKVEPKIETPKVDEISKVEPLVEPQIETPKVEEISKVEPQAESTKIEEVVPKVDIPPKVETPKVEEPFKVDTPKEVPKLPKIEIPNVTKENVSEKPKVVHGSPKISAPKTNVQKQSQESKELPKGGSMSDKAKILPKVDVTKLMEVKPMADENAEKQLEELLKKREFQKNIEDAATFALESKDKIESISKEITDIEGQIGTVSKSVGELCTGVDCIKDDIKKYQDAVPTLEKQINEKNTAIEKQIDTKFDELTKRIQKLETPTFVCDNCGDPSIRPLSSFCSNCGSPIHNWTDENGMPIRGWTPYWKRMGKIDSGQEVQ